MDIKKPLVKRRSSVLNPSASPFHSSNKTNGTNPFFEPEYPSQRFKPEVSEDKNANDTYYSPPSTFSPPDSPNGLSAEGSSSSAEPFADSRTRHSSSSKDYTGVTLVPGQISNLSTYGIYGPTSTLSGTPSDNNTKDDIKSERTLAHLRGGGCTYNSNEDPVAPANRAMPFIPRKHGAVGDSPFSSSSDIYPSSGVALNGADHTNVSLIQHQTHTFADLAANRGIREWNNCVFDDRWVLQPDETWKTDPSQSSTTTFSPPGQSIGYMMDELPFLSARATETSRSSSVYQAEIDRLNRELDELKKKRQELHKETMLSLGRHNEKSTLPDNTAPKQVANNQRSLPEANVPVPPELARMTQCVEQLQSGTASLPAGLIHSRESVRQWFWNHVFPGVDDPIRLPGRDSTKTTILHGHSRTLAAVRQDVLESIEDLTNFIISPAGEGVRRRAQAGVADPSPSPNVIAQANPNRHREVTPFRAPNDQSSTFVEPDINAGRGQTSGATTSERSPPIDKHRKVKNQTIVNQALLLNQEALGRFKVREEDDETPRPSDKNQQTFEETYDRGRIPGGIRQPSTVAESKQQETRPLAYGVPQHLASGFYPTPTYHPVPFHGAMNLNQHSWGVQGVQHNPYVTPSSMGFGMQWQPTYHQPPPAFGQVPLATYVPPPMPYASAYARPPATGRLARMFNRATPSPGPETAIFRPQSAATAPISEWQNRYGSQATVMPDLPVLPYRVGSDDMYRIPGGAASSRYQDLSRASPLTLEMVTAEENMPFAENAKLMKPPQWGVLKIGNIPYDLTKAQILNFLGTHAKIIASDFGPAIHIMMDRTTGKTMDCFVEFYSTPDARACSNSFGLRPNGMNRIGERVVEIGVSSQEELLKEMFPKAKNVSWDGGKPNIKGKEDEFSSGFKSFVSAEELGCLVRHAEQPHRSNFTLRSPQRTYESLISLLAKFPWYDVKNYTVATRNQIFQSTRTMLQILSINLRKGYQGHSSINSDVSIYGRPSSHGRSPSLGGTPMLTQQLLKDLLMAALNAPGFSEKQRWELFQGSEYGRVNFRLSPLLKYWPWEVLSRKVHAEEDVVEFYAKLITRNPVSRPTGRPFGGLEHLTEHFDLEVSSMEQIGEMESTMFYALMEGSISGEIGQEMEAALKRIAEVEAGLY